MAHLETLRPLRQMFDALLIYSKKTRPRRTGAPAVTPTPRPNSTPTPQPTQAPSTTVTFVSVQGGSPGAYASVTVQTSPYASCSIRYIVPSGRESTAQGLVPKTADGSGRVSWSWKIGTNTTPGNGQVIVTCNGVTASAPITLS